MIATGSEGSALWRLALLVSVVLALQVPVSSAQEPASDVPTIHIYSSFDSYNRAGAFSELDLASDQFAGFVHPNEIFSDIPGAWISRGSGQEHLSAIRSPVLTGSGACGAVLWLEDEVPIRPTGFCNINNLFETTLEFADGVEVVRGPAAATFGGNALHGAVNVKYRASGRPSERVGLSTELGPWKYRALKFRWVPAEHNRTDLGIFVAQDGGYRADSGYDLYKMRFSQQWGDENQVQWHVKMSAIDLQQETASYIQGYESYSQSEEVRRANANPEAYRDASATRVMLERYSSDKSAQLRLVARTNDMSFLQHFLPCQPLEQNHHQSLAVFWSKQYRASGPSDSTYSWGLQAEVADIHLDQYQELAPDQCDVFAADRFAQGAHYNFDVASENLALWFNGYQEFATTGLIWNLRAETLQYDYTNNLPAGPVTNSDGQCGTAETICRYSRPPSGIDDFSLAAGRVAWVVPASGWQWHLALSSGYRPPQIAELYRLQQGQTTADLNPVFLTQVEWGGVYEAGTISLDWSLYSSEKDNYIFLDGDRFLQSDGATSHLGAELEALWRLHRAHQLLVVLAVSDHRYRFDSMDGETIMSGNQVDTAPPVLGSVSWKWAVTPRVQTELEMLHTSSYYLDAGNEHKYSGHNVLNAKISWRIDHTVSLSLRWQNVLDVEYANRADYTLFQGYRYFPGLPASLYATVRWRL
ncbi:MAG: TonB-dependent receptor [Gammaproteobacteria bacterium]